MTLSRWRRIATGIAAGVIVLCAALLGASFRSDNNGVSVASEVRPSVIIPIEEDPVEDEVAAADATADASEDNADSADATADASEDNADSADATAEDAAATDQADTDDAADSAATGDSASGDTAESDAGNDEALSEPVTVIETDEAPADDGSDDTAAEPEPAAPSTPAAPLTSGDDNLGTGGGVDDAECALDRLVIYAGARVGGVAGKIRAALNQAGFAASCPTPVTVLASNCPLQFAGVLGAGSGYDPSKSFVASSSNVDRETMTAVMGSVGYTGSQIDILDFGFVNPDQPGEQWMAIFVPPSFEGWQDLASRAGLPITSQSLCSPSGQLAG